MALFPASLVLGIIGIVRDATKWPAILVTIVSGGLLFFFFLLPLLSRIIC